MKINNYLVATKSALRMILINLTLALALVSIHEMAHVMIGIHLGCKDGKAILFDSQEENPYAELLCLKRINLSLISISSLIAGFCFGLSFLLLGNREQKSFAFIIFGFSIIFSSLDITSITSQILFYPLLISGLGITTLGEILLANCYLE